MIETGWLRAVRVAALALALFAGPLPAAAETQDQTWAARLLEDEVTKARLWLLFHTITDPAEWGPREDAGAAYERRDYATALAILRPLAEQGEAEAQWILGFMYADGRGVAKDEREAVRWYRLAAEQGLAEAQFNLGVRYALGRGVPEYKGEAVRWFRLAAEQDDALAQYNLGVMYDFGVGVPKDDREAVGWYRRAAEWGYPVQAQTSLAVKYALGQGVAQDSVRAYMWFNIAAARGDDEHAGKLRDEWIAKVMTRAQIAEAQRLSSEWRPKAAGAAAAERPGLPLPGAYGADPALVAEAQRRLGQLGYDAGPADGVAGKRTRGAVAAYQRASGLREDGVIDAALVDHLRRAVAARAAPPAERQPAVTGSGSGFFVSADGHVLSNAHVVQGCRRIRVQPPGGEATGASLLARAAGDDLALLKAETDAAAAQFRTGSPLRQGESVLAYGFPLAGALASSGNATVGHVTALAGLGDDSRLLQISAPVQPGNSGGPLLDASGGVVGVIVGKLDALKTARAIGDIPQNVNFAIKASVATNFLEAQGVPFATQPAGRALPTEDVAERARAITVRVECWK